MMKLLYKLVQQWPKLAWVARFRKGAEEIEVLHGPMVETRPEWCFEGVWAGDFADGGFDRTDVVFGTGIRLREGKAFFVGFGCTQERLWHSRNGDVFHVSNSLPALMAAAGISLLPDYLRYSEDMWSICGGLGKYKKIFPAEPVELQMVYFANLLFDGETLQEVDKPDVAPAFNNYQGYTGYLAECIRRMGENMRDAARANAIVPITTVSSGYDSGACAVLSRHAGCDQAVTIHQATSLWRGSDSGEAIAGMLGLSCKGYPRTAGRFPNEIAVWSIAGRPGPMNWTLFDYPQPLSLMFAGHRGDSVWKPARKKVLDPFVVSSISDLGIGEFRLSRGVFMCSVPFIGIRHWCEIEEISLSDEMAPWRLGGGYDRPIARRLLEEAGVPRGTFAVRKKNTAHDARFPWPYSPEAQEAFRRFLRKRGRYAPAPWLAALLRRLGHLDSLVYKNTPARLRSKRRTRPWEHLTNRSLLFQWANWELKERYQEGLEHSGRAVMPRSGRASADMRAEGPTVADSTNPSRINDDRRRPSRRVSP